jgi:hypothetical protein
VGTALSALGRASEQRGRTSRQPGKSFAPLASPLEPQLGVVPQLGAAPGKVDTLRLELNFHEDTQTAEQSVRAACGIWC